MVIYGFFSPIVARRRYAFLEKDTPNFLFLDGFPKLIMDLTT